MLYQNTVTSELLRTLHTIKTEKTAEQYSVLEKGAAD
jgi:hypothetical protein